MILFDVDTVVIVQVGIKLPEIHYAEVDGGAGGVGCNVGKLIKKRCLLNGLYGYIVTGVNILKY